MANPIWPLDNDPGLSTAKGRSMIAAAFDKIAKAKLAKQSAAKLPKRKNTSK